MGTIAKEADLLEEMELTSVGCLNEVGAPPTTPPHPRHNLRTRYAFTRHPPYFLFLREAPLWRRHRARVPTLPRARVMGGRAQADRKI